MLRLSERNAFITTHKLSKPQLQCYSIAMTYIYLQCKMSGVMLGSALPRVFRVAKPMRTLQGVPCQAPVRQTSTSVSLHLSGATR